jgi:hypothetical protein
MKSRSARISANQALTALRSLRVSLVIPPNVDFSPDRYSEGENLPPVALPSHKRLAAIGQHATGGTIDASGGGGSTVISEKRQPRPTPRTRPLSGYEQRSARL